MNDDKVAAALRECEEAVVKRFHPTETMHRVRAYGEACRETKLSTIKQLEAKAYEHGWNDKVCVTAGHKDSAFFCKECLAAARLAGRQEIFAAIDESRARHPGCCHHIFDDIDRLRRETGK